MRSGLRRGVTAALWLGLWAGGATVVAAPAEVAKTRSPAGTSTFTRDGKTADIGPTTELRQLDVVRVPDNGRLTIEYADKSTVTLVGPATVGLGEMSEEGRRMMLHSGVVSEAKVKGTALEIQAPDPNNASLVLQDASGFARVNPGDKIVFQKIAGAYAKAWKDGKDSDLGESQWVMNIRSGAAASAIPQTQPASAAPAGAAADPNKPKSFVEMKMDGDRAVITNGVKPIVFYPASAFTRERTSDGQGFRVTFTGPEGDYGVVEIGRETTMFVASGEYVEFDASGNVVRSNGISYHYHPLFDALHNVDPVRDGTDASPSLSRHR